LLRLIHLYASDVDDDVVFDLNHLKHSFYDQTPEMTRIVNTLLTILLLYIIEATHAAPPTPDPALLPWIHAATIVTPHLIIILFTTIYLYKHIHSDMATNTLMKEYIVKGKVVQGKVLSCEPRKKTPGKNDDDDKNVTIDVLYKATQHKFENDARANFRNPEAIVQKQYLRRFQSQRDWKRGDSIEVLLLQWYPRSGCTREVVERNLAGYDDRKIASVYVPGLCFVAIVLAWGVVSVVWSQGPGLHKNKGLEVLACGFAAIQFVVWVYFYAQFMKAKLRKFGSAKAMVTSSVGSKNKTIEEKKSD